MKEYKQLGSYGLIIKNKKILLYQKIWWTLRWET